MASSAAELLMIGTPEVESKTNMPSVAGASPRAKEKETVGREPHQYGRGAARGRSALVAGILHHCPALQVRLALLAQHQAIAGLPDRILQYVTDLYLLFAFLHLVPPSQACLTQCRAAG